MKTAVLSMMFISLVTLVGVTSASAQVTETVKFTTAFPFTAGNTMYPAGSYSIKPVDDTDSGAMEITNGKTTTLLVVQPQEPQGNQPVKDEVVFKKYGDQYVLSEIWDAADGTGARTEQSPAERRHAANHGEPTKESVSASRNLASGS